MRVTLVAVGLVVMSSLLAAQQPPAPAAAPSAAALKTFAASGDVAALVTKAKAERRPDQALVAQPLLQLAPYNVNIEYRTAVANAAVHEREAELFYVIDGAGTVVTGGTLVAPNRTNADNLTGTGISAGTSRHVAKGDVVLVPENTPHWFSAIEGSLTLMSLHLPRAAR